MSHCLLLLLSPPEVIPGVVKLLTWMVQHGGSFSPRVWPVETQSSAFSAAVNQAVPTNVNFALSSRGFKKKKKRKKKKGNHNSNSALAKLGPFKERKFPRATLDKPGGLILL